VLDSHSNFTNKYNLTDKL